MGLDSNARDRSIPIDKMLIVNLSLLALMSSLCRLACASLKNMPGCRFWGDGAKAGGDDKEIGSRLHANIYDGCWSFLSPHFMARGIPLIQDLEEQLVALDKDRTLSAK